jgi:lipid-A-disaccharide synthase
LLAAPDAVTALRQRPLDIFLVAGEASGDALGAPLMAALKARLSGHVIFRGVGGAAMQAEGLASLYPMEDLTAMGFDAVIAKLPLLFRRLVETAAAIAATPPDLLILIDSPDFNQRLGRRVRRALPALPIIKYVSPTVWAWRPGRAKAMRPVFDHVLALFPFEPAVHERLGGPPCTYVGHPLLERLGALRPSPAEAAARDGQPLLVLVLPGSRRSEIQRLGPVFGEALGLLAGGRRIEFVLPTLPLRLDQVSDVVRRWPVQPKIVVTETEKLAAFRRARAALAASGTVTLELALAHVPTVAAYRVSALEAPILRRVIRSPSVILPNLILGENVVPEFHQEHCTAEKLASALLPLIDEGPARRRQLDAFARLDALMAIGDEHPSERAARVAMQVYEQRAGRVVPGEAEDRDTLPPATD